VKHLRINYIGDVNPLSLLCFWVRISVEIPVLIEAGYEALYSNELI